MYPMCVAYYLSDITKQRTKKLREWLLPIPRGEGCTGSIISREVDKSQIHIEKIDEYQFTEFTNAYKIINEFQTSDLSIRIISLQNSSIQAQMHDEEVTENLYIAISDFKEYPNQNLYFLNEFIKPNIENVDTSNIKQPILTISYGKLNERKKIKLLLTINNIKMVSN